MSKRTMLRCYLHHFISAPDTLFGRGSLFLFVLFFLCLSTSIKAHPFVHSKELVDNLAQKVRAFDYRHQRAEPHDFPFLSQYQALQLDAAGQPVIKRLSYIAAKHQAAHTFDDFNQGTLRLLKDTFDQVQPDAVIVEGVPFSRGNLSSQPINHPISEAGYAKLLATTHNIPVTSAEPDDSVIRNLLLRKGYSDQDILGYTIGRSIEPAIRAKRLHRDNLEALQKYFDKAVTLFKSRYLMSPETTFSFEDFKSWYRQKNGKLWGVEYDPKEFNPLPEQRYFTQTIGREVVKIRDGFIVNVIADRLARYNNVLVVYGGSHLVTQRPALKALMGDPIQNYRP